MKRFALLLATSLFLIALSGANSHAAGPLKIGVTLHAYYSWVSEIVGETAIVEPIIPPGSDPHTYQPKPTDLAKLKEIDVLVRNGLGHDDYINPMLKAAGREDMTVLDPHKGLPLIAVHEQTYAFESGEKKVAYNSHTYISITGAIQQINTLADELGKLAPANAALYKTNARAYAKRLRRMQADALAKINRLDPARLRIATVHDGYAYLMQELGLKIDAVIQPRHGIEPSPRQLQDTIKRIKQADVQVLFSEMDYQKKYVDIIFQETGCRIYTLTHISNGPYVKEKFEQDMQRNLDTIVKALTDARG